MVIVGKCLGRAAINGVSALCMIRMLPFLLLLGVGLAASLESLVDNPFSEPVSVTELIQTDRTENIRRRPRYRGRMRSTPVFHRNLPRIRKVPVFYPKKSYSDFTQFLSQSSRYTFIEGSSDDTFTSVQPKETCETDSVLNTELVEDSSPCEISPIVPISSRNEDLCEKFNRRLFNHNGEYRPARPYWPGTTDECQESDFKLLRVLGRGAYGVVYHAVHRATSQNVALKFIEAEDKKYPFVRMEECLQHRLSAHPFIVKHHCTFLSTAAHPGRVVMAMELVEDVIELWDLIYKSRYDASIDKWVPMYELDEDRIAYITAQLISGLWFMHRMNVIYRDLKPENILVSADGTIKMIDFGLSNDPTKPVHRSHNRLLGTPYYFPPEFFTTRFPRFSQKSVDWWALGIMIYEMAFRDGPYPQSQVSGPKVSFEELTRHIVKGFTCVPDEDGRWTDLCRLVNRLCERNPKERLGVSDGSIGEFTKYQSFLFHTNIAEMLTEAEYLSRLDKR